MYVKQYLEWKATYAPRAAVNYRIWLDRFKFITEKDVNTAEIGDIVRYKNYLSDNFQPKSVELGMIVVKNYFKFWKLNGLSCINPELVKIPKAIPNSYQPVTFEEYISMLSFIRPNTYWELQKEVMIRLLWETGMRVSELVGLNVTDIDPEKASTTIRTKKNRLTRQIFWSIETHFMVKTLLAERRKLNSTPAFFIGRLNKTELSKRLTTRSVQRIIKELADKAGIEKQVSPHSFRHGKAHFMSHNHAQAAEIKEILGHVSPVSTFTYLQMNNKELEKIARKFL